MTIDEQALLLTVARIMRARLKDLYETHRNKVDLEDLNDIRHALAPFDALPLETENAVRMGPNQD